MAKIAMIGAGSQIFCKTLVMDIFSTPSLRGSEIRLMSRAKQVRDVVLVSGFREVGRQSSEFRSSGTSYM